MSQELKTGKKRKANGLGTTYKIKGTNSYKTVIRSHGRVVMGTAKTAQESRSKARARLAALPTFEAGVVVRNVGLTTGQFIDKWLTEEHSRNVAEKTLLRYRGLLKYHIDPAIGQIPLQHLNKGHIESMLKAMEVAGQSPRSRQQAQALLSGALSAACVHKIIVTNAAKEVSKIQLNKKPITPLNGDEVKKLLDSARGTFMCARLHIALLLGLRQGEALGLLVKDIDFDNGSISVTKQIVKVGNQIDERPLKTTASIRQISLPKHTLDALKEHLVILDKMKSEAGISWNDHGLLFPNSVGDPLNAKVDYSRWIKVLQSCGIKRRSLHNARHTAGTLLYDGNVGIETIRRILGHSSVLMTSNTYVHNSEKPLRVAAAQLDLILDE
jgi:integrase